MAAGFHPFTWPMRVAVAIPVMGAATWQLAHPGPSGHASSASAAYHRCLAGWVALLAVAVTWELTAYFSSPRDEHPTLSSIADDAMGTHAGRAITFAVWLAAGWVVFVRPRRGSPR